MNEKEREEHFFAEACGEPLLVKRDNETQLGISSSFEGWLAIDCTSEEAATLVESKFEEHFRFGRVVHNETVIKTGFEYAITQRSGYGVDGGLGSSVGTLFYLKKGNKIISKSLCSYLNGAMALAGPSIELFETAEDWRGHGYGALLLYAMEDFFADIFAKVMEEKRVRFNVCDVTNAKASRWFQNRGFRDWDGMGEELGMYLMRFDP